MILLNNFLELIMTTSMRATDSLSNAAPVHSTALPMPRVSWGAVFAGVVLALALQVLFAMLGTGIGMSTVDPLVDGASPSASSFGIGAAVWWVISSLIALFAGGWVAGRLSGMLRPAEGSIHGLLTWAIAVLATMYLLTTTVSSLVSGAGSILGTAVSATATGAAAAAPKVTELAGDQLSKAGISIDTIKREAAQVLSQTGKPDLQPGAARQQADSAVAEAKQAANSGATSDQDFSSLIERLITRGKDAASQVDRDALINVVMARSGVSREEAAKRVQGWEEKADQAKAKATQAAEQAKQKAREVADATAKNVSRAMLLGFFALAIGALAAWMGGAKGQRRGAVVETAA
jgi:hypothetical protein